MTSATTSAGSLPATSTTRPAPTPPKSVAELQEAREIVAATLAQHPEWPQRQITTDGKVLLMPYGPHDPSQYMAWLDDVGWQYRAVRLVYVPGLGNPTRAELEGIRDEVWRQVRALDVQPQTLIITVDTAGSTVSARYAPQTPELVAVFERAKQTYGDRFTFAPASDVPAYPTDGGSTTVPSPSLAPG